MPASRMRAIFSTRYSRSLGVHAGGRLVEHEQLGLGRDGAGDLDQPLDAVRQAGRRPVRELLQTQQPEGVHRALARGLLLLALAGEAEAVRQHAGVLVPVAAHEHVLERAHVAEDAQVLERARHARPRRLGGRQPGDVRALEEHASLGHGLQPAHDVEQRGLAGAVRADERGDLAFAHFHAHVVHGLEAAELDGDALDAQQDLVLLRVGDVSLGGGQSRLVGRRRSRQHLRAFRLGLPAFPTEHVELHPGRLLVLQAQ